MSSWGYSCTHASLDSLLTLLPSGSNVQRTPSQSKSILSFCLLSLICIGRYFKELIHFFSSPKFYRAQVQFPTLHTPILQKILGDRRFKFFDKCIGAVDGSHIWVFASVDDHAFMRNRKGYLSQNCLFACDFNFDVIYSLCGWDGSVTDSLLWRDAVANDLEMPPDRYLLGDAGFASCNALLVPYRGVCYHLREWWQGRTGCVCQSSGNTCIGLILV